MDENELPKDRMHHKVVQLYINGVAHIGFGDSYRKHARIIEKLLKQHSVKYETREVSNDAIPIEKGDDYELVGAGACMRLGNEISFTGSSIDYDIGINKEHLDRVEKPEGIEFHVL